jgi:hypothetical protein
VSELLGSDRFSLHGSEFNQCRNVRCELMNICHVAHFLRPRTNKLAVVQKHKGHCLLHLGSRVNGTQPSSHFTFQVIVDHNRMKNLFQAAANKFDEFEDVIWHVHNEPDYFVPWLKEVSKHPVIWDVHDLNSLRTGIPKQAEVDAFNTADAILTVGGNLITKIQTKNHRNVPIASYATYCPRVWFQSPQEPVRNLLGITTGLSLEPGHYRNWLNVFREIDKCHEILCFSGFQDVPEEYEKLGVNPPTHILRMLRELSFCEAGIAGAPHHNDLMKIADPNKLYEYMAAGIPVIVYGSNHDMCAIVKANGLGVVIDDASEIPSALEQIRKLKIRERVLEVRYNYCMETQYEDVMKLYERAK